MDTNIAEAKQALWHEVDRLWLCLAGSFAGFTIVSGVGVGLGFEVIPSVAVSLLTWTPWLVQLARTNAATKRLQRLTPPSHT